MKNLSAPAVCVIGLLVLLVVGTFIDDYIAPMIFDARIERIHEKGLPKAWVENGYVHCHMKADDFCLPLPVGYRAMPPVITAGGYDWVDGSIELRFDTSLNGIVVGGNSVWPPGRLQVGGSATVEQLPREGILVKFHYLGDR